MAEINSVVVSVSTTLLSGLITSLLYPQEKHDIGEKLLSSCGVGPSYFSVRAISLASRLGWTFSRHFYTITRLTRRRSIPTYSG